MQFLHQFFAHFSLGCCVQARALLIRASIRILFEKEIVKESYFRIHTTLAVEGIRIPSCF